MLPESEDSINFELSEDDLYKLSFTEEADVIAAN
jgi:hypothetical protein